MDFVRINILSSDNVVIGHLDNKAKNALNYYNETLHTYLEGSAATFEFTAPADHKDSGLLETGNKLSFIYDEDPYYFTIVKAVQTEDTIQVTAYGSCFELLNEKVGSYTAETALTFAQYLSVFLGSSGFLELGLNEVSSAVITNEWTGESTLLARLYSLANVFSAELEFIPQLSSNGSLIKLTLNVYKQHSETSQGVGSVRTDKILRYGKEVTGIRKTSDTTELFTAITPTGADGLTITDVAETITDDAGNVLYFTAAGSPTIYAPQARDRYPSSATEADDRYIDLAWSTDYSTAAALYGNALAKLKTGAEPKASYEVSGFFEAKIGDTVTIADQDFEPPLYLKARVVEQEICFTDESRNKTKFDNFTEMIAEITPPVETGIDEVARTLAAEAAAAAAAAQSTADDAETAAGNAATVAATAQSTADSKIMTYYQTSAPVSGMSTGDLWIDTDDGNKMYRWGGSAWVDVQDDAIAAAQEDINNLTIGGVNLARDTGDFTADNWVLSRSTATAGVLTVTPTTSNAAAKYKIDYLLYGDRKDKTYTLSFDMRYLTGGTYSDPKICRAYAAVNPVARLNNVLSSSYDRLGFKDFTPTTNWTRYTYTFSVPEDLTSGAAGALIDSSYLTFEFYKASQGAAVEIKNIMFEEGNRATTWQPAPEDVAADITTAQTTATEAKTMAQATQNYFWHDSAGAHVSDTEGALTGKNVLIDSNGMAVKDGSAELATFGANLIELGKNSSAAEIEFVNGLLSMAYERISASVGDQFRITNTAADDDPLTTQLWIEIANRDPNEQHSPAYLSLNQGGAGDYGSLALLRADTVQLRAVPISVADLPGRGNIVIYGENSASINAATVTIGSLTKDLPVVPYASYTGIAGVALYRQLNIVTCLINKQVTLTASTEFSLGTIPTGYRPAFAFPFVAQIAAAAVPQASARGVVYTDGRITVTCSSGQSNRYVYAALSWITDDSIS